MGRLIYRDFMLSWKNKKEQIILLVMINLLIITGIANNTFLYIAEIILSLRVLKNFIKDEIKWNKYDNNFENIKKNVISKFCVYFIDVNIITFLLILINLIYKYTIKNYQIFIGNIIFTYSISIISGSILLTFLFVVGASKCQNYFILFVCIMTILYSLFYRIDLLDYVINMRIASVVLGLIILVICCIVSILMLNLKKTN